MSKVWEDRPRTGRNICERHIWQKTVTQNIPRTLNRQRKKINISIRNMSMTLTHTTPKTYRWQINIMERYSTSLHQRNANQNNEYHNLSVRMANTQNTTTSNVDMDMEQLKLIHCWGMGQRKRYQPLWKTVWWCLTKLNIPYHPAITLFGT